MKLKNAGIVTGVVLAGAGILAGVETIGSAGARTPSHMATPAHAHAISPRLRSAYAILRSGLVADASSTAALERHLSPADITTYGLSVGASRTVTVDGLNITVVPGSSGVCLVMAKPISIGSTPGTVSESGCDSTSDALNYGVIDSLYSASPTGSGATFAVLVPDGNTQISVDGTGFDAQAPVTNNVAVANAQASSTTSEHVTLTFRNANGKSVSSAPQLSGS